MYSLRIFKKLISKRTTEKTSQSKDTVGRKPVTRTGELKRKERRKVKHVPNRNKKLNPIKF